MQKITPFLWFENQAEEAARFYVSIFKNSRMGSITRYPEGTPGLAGQVMAVAFHLDGMDFTGLNGGPVFKFNEAISFVVSCETQDEVDSLWEKLSAHPEAEHCGWLKDKYGVSWQIIPIALIQLLSDPDRIRAQRVMQAMLSMKKIDLNLLQKAHANG